MRRVGMIAAPRGSGARRLVTVKRRVPARLAALAVGAALAAAVAAESGVEPVNQTRLAGRAIHGYDTVAYFEEKGAVRGSTDWTHEWNGATWLFVSAANRDRFAASPERYTPQYGGYCAWAVSRGYTADIDPDAWSIRDGKLYLNYNSQVQERWLAVVDEAIREADRNWPGLRDDSASP